jgi:hypothetical protein
LKHDSPTIMSNLVGNCGSLLLDRDSAAAKASASMAAAARSASGFEMAS